jgi:hypothetical protein
MHLTPDDIAASISNDPAIKAEDVLYKYLMDEGTIRFEALKEHFATFGMDLTEQEMIRIMAIQEDILFTEDADDRGRFWRASIVPDQHSGPTEGYLDHRVTDQYDDAIDQDFEGEEDFTDQDIAGINATPDAGQMNSMNAEGAPGDPGAFGTQTQPPDIDALPTDQTDQSEIPPAAVPRSMPNIVAQAMAPAPGEDALEPGIPEPGMQPGPMDQIDMGQAPAGPGEEQPAPQTGAISPGQMTPEVMQMAQQIAQQMHQQMMQQPGQPQMGQPQMGQPQMGQPQMGQEQQEAEPDFGEDGASYTIDPFLNSLNQESNVGEGSDIQQSPQTSNQPSTGARTRQDKRYSKRMKEARGKRLDTLNE